MAIANLNLYSSVAYAGLFEVTVADAELQIHL